MEQLKEILEKHKLWLESKEGGERANLRYADLKEANLRYADLKEANLRYADLKEADLTNADLKEANLRYANLREADLANADLKEADLTNADLWNCTGNGKEIRTIQTEYYTINLTKYFIQIGCKQHTVEQWKSFTDYKISKMGSDALEFWNKYKDYVFLSWELAFGE